jgi:transitional endoplasmic reticulum ATPase
VIGMDNSMNVEAHRSFYEQGMAAFKAGDMVSARQLLLKAAEIAAKISNTAITYEVKHRYLTIAYDILDFVKTKCVKSLHKVKSQDNRNEVENIAVKPLSKSPQDKITFDDVAGLEDVKEEIRYKVLAPMKTPELAKLYKINPGGKILLYGPPGTGKTFIARAIAGEVDAEFYAVNCQDLISKYMGESSKQLNALFEKAQAHERAIIFFDEIDAIASKRESKGGGADAEMARFVATFLTKVDGFPTQPKPNKMLLLIAATNRPWAIDAAMLRGGRFDTQIYVGLPDQQARLFLVKKSLEGVPAEDDFSMEELSQALEGYGGGDIVSICEKIRLQAYKRAVQTGKAQKIAKADCHKAISGQRNIITKEELLRFENYRAGIKGGDYELPIE